jgi:protoheme IX farnesyltransferase
MQPKSTFDDARHLFYSEASAKDYFELLKPRVMALVIFTATCGLLLNPGSIHPFLGLLALVCIATGAGGSGCLNMWIERHIDGKMKRTANRPLPAGKIDPSSALAFGLILSVGSVSLLGVFINYTAGALLAFTIFFYCCVYTIFLKPRTAQNIVIGGLAGALPPVIGWACVGSVNQLMPWVLMLIIFLWTPAHFWALSLSLEEDYEKANYPMLSLTLGKKAMFYWIMIHTLLTVLASFIPLGLGYGGLAYAFTAFSLGAVFIYMSYQLIKQESHKKAIHLFIFSIFYLFLLFLVLTAENSILTPHHSMEIIGYALS